MSETDTDMTRWPTVKHFNSWLGVAPGSRQSGKHRESQKRFRGRAGRLFCVAARSLARSKHLALGGFYRRIRATCGGQVANIASARKIAELYYNTLGFGDAYVEKGLKASEEKYRLDSIRRLKAVARKFGYKLAEAPQNEALAPSKTPAFPLARKPRFIGSLTLPGYEALQARVCP